MQFNSDSDNQDIVSLVGDATGLNTTAEIKQITRAVNRAGKLIWSWIFETYGGWQYDDSNNTDLPFARTDLVEGQNKYTMPNGVLSFASVEVANSDGPDDYTKLKAVPLEKIEQFMSEEEHSSTDGTPTHYALVSNVLKIYPKPDKSITNGLRIRIKRGSVTFASTDTTQTPGFVSEFHEALADGASYYIGINKNLSNLAGLQAQWNQWEPKIKSYYTKRWEELNPREVRNGDYTNNVI